MVENIEMAHVEAKQRLPLHAEKSMERVAEAEAQMGMAREDLRYREQQHEVAVTERSGLEDELSLMAEAKELLEQLGVGKQPPAPPEPQPQEVLIGVKDGEEFEMDEDLRKKMIGAMWKRIREEEKKKEKREEEKRKLQNATTTVEHQYTDDAEGKQKQGEIQRVALEEYGKETDGVEGGEEAQQEQKDGRAFMDENLETHQMEIETQLGTDTDDMTHLRNIDDATMEKDSSSVNAVNDMEEMDTMEKNDESSDKLILEEGRRSQATALGDPISQEEKEGGKDAIGIGERNAREERVEEGNNRVHHEQDEKYTDETNLKVEDRRCEDGEGNNLGNEEEEDGPRFILVPPTEAEMIEWRDAMAHYEKVLAKWEVRTSCHGCSSFLSNIDILLYSYQLDLQSSVKKTRAGILTLPFLMSLASHNALHLSYAKDTE